MAGGVKFEIRELPAPYQEQAIEKILPDLMRRAAQEAEKMALAVAAENAAGPEDKSQEAEYCLVCLRWSECNGVDLNCPIRNRKPPRNWG